MNKAEYYKIVKRIHLLQSDLMDIDNYDEEVYQAFESLIEVLDNVIEGDTDE